MRISNVCVIIKNEKKIQFFHKKNNFLINKNQFKYTAAQYNNSIKNVYTYQWG